MGIQSLDRADLLLLLQAARAKRERDFLMILVAFAHGLRASEVVALTPDNITATHIDVKRLKGSLRTVQPLLEHAHPLLNERAALIEYVRGLPRNQRIFNVSRVRFWQLLQEHGRTAGIPEHKRHPHVLKHSIAMQIIDGVGIHRTQKYLGHKSIASTGEYLKDTEESAAARVHGVLAD